MIEVDILISIQRTLLNINKWLTTYYLNNKIYKIMYIYIYIYIYIFINIYILTLLNLLISGWLFPGQ